MTEILSQEGYTVVPANNGAEARSLFGREEFDLVITDSDLPFLNGNELAAQIKAMAPAQPILMVSQVWRRPGPDSPVDAALHRSCHPERLRQVVAELLTRELVLVAEGTDLADKAAADLELASA